MRISDWSSDVCSSDLLSFHGGERKALWLFLITIPFWTSYLLRVFAWKIVLGYNGVVNASLLELGIIAEPMEFLLYNVNSVVITLAHAWRSEERRVGKERVSTGRSRW